MNAISKTDYVVKLGTIVQCLDLFATVINTEQVINDMSYHNSKNVYIRYTLMWQTGRTSKTRGIFGLQVISEP